MSTSGLSSSVQEQRAGDNTVVVAGPAARATVNDERDSLEIRQRLLRRYGNFTLAYSAATQPGLEHFVTEDGFIAHQRKWGISFVLADPVASEERKPRLLREFLRAFPKATFVQISRSTAKILEQERFFINEMGLDFKLDLTNYDFKGKQKERLRYSANRLQKKGFRVEELTVEEAGGPDLIRSVSEAWRTALVASGHHEEVRFLNRPPVYADEPDVRKFFVFDSADKLVAFFVFDPIYDQGEIIGYSMSVKRRTPEADLRTEEAVSKIAIEKFQAEGKHLYMLGLAPMAGVEDKEFRCNWFIHNDFVYVFRAGWVNRYRYPLKAHYDFRLRYRGEPVKVYFATRTWIYTVRAIGLLRIMRMPMLGIRRRRLDPPR